MTMNRDGTMNARGRAFDTCTAEGCTRQATGDLVNLATGARQPRCSGHLHNVELPPGWRMER